MPDSYAYDNDARPRDTRTTVLGEQRPVVVLGDGASDNVALYRPDGYLKIAADASPLIAETFDGALDTTDRWTTGGTAPTSTAGTLTINQGTTALAVSSLTSKATFPLLGNMFNVVLGLVKVDPTLKTGAYRWLGVGNAAGSPTVAAPVTDGVGFEWIDTTGVLSGVVWSGGVRTQALSLSAVQPLDANLHRYEVYFKTSRAYFEIDNIAVGSIAYPNPNTSNLPFLALAVNGASTVSPAALYQSSFFGIGDSSTNNQFISDASFPWRKAAVTAVGRQGAFGVATQDLKDSGRVAVALFGTALAVGATGVEAALTLTKSAGTAANTSAASFVVTSAKRFRITSITASQVGNVTATAATSVVSLRLNTAGVVTTGSAPIVLAGRVATPATSGAQQVVQLEIPEGLEILGDGTLQIGATVNSVYVTNAPTVDLTIIGYEY
jgi:hypothetical protein